MVDFFLVSSNVSGHLTVSCLRRGTYTSAALGLAAFHFPCIRSFQFPTPRFVYFMRAPSFFTLLLVVGQICKLLSFGHTCNRHTDQRWCYSVPDVSVSLAFRRGGEAIL